MPVIMTHPPTITVEGTALTAALYDSLIDVRIEHALGAPSRATLRLSDPTFELIDGTAFEVSKVLTVSFPDDTGSAVEVFNGEIVSLGVESPMGANVEGFEITVIAYDQPHAMTHKGATKKSLDLKYSDIVASIASECGLSADVTATSIVHKYFLATGSHYETVDSIARLLGFEWRVEGSKLIMRPRPANPSAVVLKYGTHIRRLRVRYTANERSKTIEVRSWDPTTKTAVVATSNEPGSPPTAVVGDSTLVSSQRAKVASTAAARRVHTIGAASTDEATAIAKGLGTHTAATELYVRGECLGNPNLTLGSSVDIQNAGNRVSGKYYLTSVEHVFGRQTDFLTRFSCGGTEPSTIVDLLGGRTPAVPAFGANGLYIGIVTNHKDPDKLGRVKVKFPTLADNIESAWARVVAVGGGPDTGLLAMPKVNDEVLVGFEHGDLRRPYVLGGLYNGKDKPPITAHADSGDAAVVGGSVVQWKMQTGGHALTMKKGTEDADVHCKIALDGNVATLYLGKDKVELISTNKSVTVKNGKASIVLSDSGDVTIKGTNITLEAQSNLDLKGTNINAKANAGFKAEASAQAELKGTAGVTIQAAAATQIKGNPLMLN